MLIPDKHVNPRLTVIYLGGLIIGALKNNGIMTHDELLALLMEKNGDKARNIYHSALSFLFLLGKIRYHQKIDSFELLRGNNSDQDIQDIKVTT